MAILYHVIVLYLSISLIIHLLREKKAPDQISTAIVLMLFLLRLFLLK